VSTATRVLLQDKSVWRAFAKYPTLPHVPAPARAEVFVSTVHAKCRALPGVLTATPVLLPHKFA